MNEMKKWILFGVFLGSFFQQGWSQEWLAAKSFGTCEGGVIFQVLEPTQEGYIIAGSMYAPSLQMGSFTLTAQGQQDAVIAGLDHQLSVQWAFNLSAQGNFTIANIATDQLGNMYVAAGFTGLYFVMNQDTIYNLGDSDMILMKLNADREVEWVQHYATPFQDGAGAIICDADNLIYFSWYTADFNGNSQQEIIKLNGIGELLWSKQTNSDMSVSRMEITPDNHLLLAGTVLQIGVISDGVQVTNPDEFDSVFLLYYDLEGNHTETNLLTEYAFFHDLKLNQGQLFILGSMKGVDQPVSDWLTKYDATYQRVWSKPLFSCSSELYYLDFSPKMQVTEEGTILIAGGFLNDYVCFGDQTFHNIPVIPNSPFAQRSLTFLMEWDAIGQPLGMQVRGEDLRNHNLQLVRGTDGNMLSLGVFQSSALEFGNQRVENPCPLDTMIFPIHGIQYLYRSVYTYAATFKGRIETSTFFKERQSFLLYPNPSQNHFYLRSEAFSEKPVQVQLFSTDGKLLSQQNILPMGNSLRVETAALPPGLYIVNVISEGQLSAQRFVKY
jgi:hypothetical protein